MNEIETQAKRRFFHREATLIPVSDCYDFVVYPNGLMSTFKGQRSAGNEKVILYFLARHMSQETPEGETTEFKDVAQTFWFKHEYISDRTGLTANRISEALKSLTEAGVLIHKVERGVGQHIAFSNTAIDAWVDYSRVQALMRIKRTSGQRKPTVPVNGSQQFRKAEVETSGQRKPTVPVNGNGSYIEDLGIGFSESDPASDSVDGWRWDNQPANRALVGIGQEFQKIFEQRSKYIDWPTINMGLAEIVSDAGGDIREAWRFTVWAQRYVQAFSGSKGLKWKDPKMQELIKRYRDCVNNGSESFPTDHRH